MEWIWLIIAICLALVVGIAITYIILRPRLKVTQEYNEITYYENEELKSENIRLQAESSSLQSINTTLFDQNEKLTAANDSATKRLDELNGSILRAEKQAQEAADLFYQSKMEVAQNKLNQELAELAKKHQENIDHFSEAYKEVVEDSLNEYQTLSELVAVMKATSDAAVEAAKRAEEMKDNLAFYRIQLSADDAKEIELLRSVEPYLRDKEPLNKVIWKCYYEKPTTDMIGRVVGSGVKTGIYKLTEIETGKCYVGQAANIADRWKQHIKRGIGAETPTRNKLYPAMIAAGPENFTFEVVEICDRAALDAREDYWQDYFKAKEFGYSIK